MGIIVVSITRVLLHLVFTQGLQVFLLVLQESLDHVILVDRVFLLSPLLSYPQAFLSIPQASLSLPQAPSLS